MNNTTIKVNSLMSKKFGLKEGDVIGKGKFSSIINGTDEEDNNIKILIVDNSEIMRSVFKNNVMRRDVEIYEAENGLEALEITKNTNIDLIVLDVNMPIIGGVEFLKTFRETNSETKTIICTTEAGKDNIKNVGDFVTLGGLSRLLRLKFPQEEEDDHELNSSDSFVTYAAMSALSVSPVLVLSAFAMSFFGIYGYVGVLLIFLINLFVAVYLASNWGMRLRLKLSKLLKSLSGFK